LNPEQGRRPVWVRFGRRDAQFETVGVHPIQREIAESLGRAGRAAEGLTVIEQAIERCERTNERWLFAELLRLKGELLLPGEKPSRARAEDNLREALDWARRQGALSWELRAATSLGRLVMRSGSSW
jgi:predicted ATPase